MRLADGDNEVLAPEYLDLTGADILVAFVEIGEMEYKEVVVVVFVYLRTLVCAAAVLDIEGVEIVILKQITEVIFGRIGYMFPFQGSVLDGLNHGFLPSFLCSFIISSCKIGKLLLHHGIIMLLVINFLHSL